MTSHGMIHQSSCPHTLQQNGVANHKLQHIIDTARTLLTHSNATLKFWGDAILTAGYLILSVTKYLTLFYSLITLCFIFFFMFFGSTCFVHDLTPGLDKLKARAIKCIFLDYSCTQKGYWCYSLANHRFYMSVDVTFFEDTPFFNSSISSKSVSQLLPIPSVIPHRTVSSPPSAPLFLIYHRCPQPQPVEAPLTEETGTSSLAPIIHPVAVDSDLSITIHKGNCTTQNPHPIYNF